MYCETHYHFFFSVHMGKRDWRTLFLGCMGIWLRGDNSLWVLCFWMSREQRHWLPFCSGLAFQGSWYKWQRWKTEREIIPSGANGSFICCHPLGHMSGRFVVACSRCEGFVVPKLRVPQLEHKTRIHLASFTSPPWDSEIRRTNVNMKLVLFDILWVLSLIQESHGFYKHLWKCGRLTL